MPDDSQELVPFSNIVAPKQKVLVVDDEVLNRRLIAAMLKTQGYEVILAEDGADCLRKVEKCPPDLILMDIMMPNLNGFETIPYLKSQERLAIIPIIMVTALQDVRDRVKALELGADDFLTKPVDRMELRARVRSLLKVKAYNDHMVNYRQELEEEVAKQTLALKMASSKIAEAHAKLRNASLETIFRLARAAEYKDAETGNHIISMSWISAFLAGKMGLNAGVVECILYASPLHDIGKIAIPDRILNKNGPLDADDWMVMRTHPALGAQILEGSGIGFLRLGEIVAQTHHEKWDGSGYPTGLAGKRIPLASRIVSVADVFDALMSKRPYKDAFSFSESTEIIKAGSGTHFDPAVVQVFMDNLESILKIWETAQSESGLATNFDRYSQNNINSWDD